MKFTGKKKTKNPNSTYFVDVGLNNSSVAPNTPQCVLFPHCKDWDSLNVDPFDYSCEPPPVTCLGLMGRSGVWGKLQVEILSKINGQAQRVALSWKGTRDVAP